MLKKAAGMVALRDLVAEMEAYNDLAVDALFSEEAAAQFQECVKELKDWQPDDVDLTFDTLCNGVFGMIAGAHALHNTAVMQEAGGNADAAANMFSDAQECLRKAVVALQKSVEFAAGITREAATAPRADQTLH